MENRMTIEKYIQNQAISGIEDNCLKSTQDFLKLLSSKWTINILYVLNKNSIKRFGELKKEIPGITSVMLSSTLRKLEKFDEVRIDNYYWLNERDNPEVLDYLNQENEYYQKSTEHTKVFQEKLFEEIC